jgi:hypothetical protein
MSLMKLQDHEFMTDSNPTNSVEQDDDGVCVHSRGGNGCNSKSKAVDLLLNWLLLIHLTTQPFTLLHPQQLSYLLLIVHLISSLICMFCPPVM